MKLLRLFLKIHTHPVNIALHILAALMFVIGVMFVDCLPLVSFFLFAAGLASLIIGHRIEGSMLAAIHDFNHEQN